MQDNPYARALAEAEGLDPRFSEALGKLIAKANAEGVKLSVGNSKRDIATQARLYARYKAGKGPIAAKPTGHAPHVRGVAADLDGDLMWAQANGAEFGLYFPLKDGKGPKHEDWHVQLDERGGGRASAPQGVDLAADNPYALALRQAEGGSAIVRPGNPKEPSGYRNPATPQSPALIGAMAGAAPTPRLSAGVAGAAGSALGGVTRRASSGPVNRNMRTPSQVAERGAAAAKIPDPMPGYTAEGYEGDTPIYVSNEGLANLQKAISAGEIKKIPYTLPLKDVNPEGKTKHYYLRPAALLILQNMKRQGAGPEAIYGFLRTEDADSRRMYRAPRITSANTLLKQFQKVSENLGNAITAPLQVAERVVGSPTQFIGDKGLAGYAGHALSGAILSPVDLAIDMQIYGKGTVDATPEQKKGALINLVGKTLGGAVVGKTLGVGFQKLAPKVVNALRAAGVTFGKRFGVEPPTPEAIHSFLALEMRKNSGAAPLSSRNPIHPNDPVQFDLSPAPKAPALAKPAGAPALPAKALPHPDDVVEFDLAPTRNPVDEIRGKLGAEPEPHPGTPGLIDVDAIPGKPHRIQSMQVPGSPLVSEMSDRDLANWLGKLRAMKYKPNKQVISPWAIDGDLEAIAQELSVRRGDSGGKVVKGVNPAPIGSPMEAARLSEIDRNWSLHEVEDWADQKGVSRKSATAHWKGYADTNLPQVTPLRQAGDAGKPPGVTPKVVDATPEPSPSAGVSQLKVAEEVAPPASQPKIVTQKREPAKPLSDYDPEELESLRETARAFEKGEGSPLAILGPERHAKWKELDKSGDWQAADAFLTDDEKFRMFQDLGPAGHSLDDIDHFMAQTEGIRNAESARELGYWLRNKALNPEKNSDAILAAVRKAEREGWDPNEIIDAAEQGFHAHNPSLSKDAAPIWDKIRSQAKQGSESVNPPAKTGDTFGVDDNPADLFDVEALRDAEAPRVGGLPGRAGAVTKEPIDILEGLIDAATDQKPAGKVKGAVVAFLGNTYDRLKVLGPHGVQVSKELEKVLLGAGYRTSTWGNRLRSSVEANFGRFHSVSKTGREALGRGKDMNDIVSRVERGETLSKAQQAVWDVWVKINKQIAAEGTKYNVHVERIVGDTLPIERLRGATAEWFVKGERHQGIITGETNGALNVRKADGSTAKLEAGQVFSTKTLANPEKYFPRELKQGILEKLDDPTSAEFKRVVEYLIEKKQADTEAQARAIVRRMLNTAVMEIAGPSKSRLRLERSGALLPPEFYERDFLKVGERHIAKASLDLSAAQIWGGQSERLAAVLEKMEHSGKISAAYDLVQRSIGKHPQSTIEAPGYRVAAGEGAYTALTKLTGIATTIRQLTQVASSTGALGPKAALQSALKLTVDLLKKDRPLHGAVKLSGVVDQDVLSLQGFDDLAGAARNITQVAMTGVKQLDGAARRHAAITGLIAFKDAVKKLKVSTSGVLHKNAAYRVLSEWYDFTDADIVRFAKGTGKFTKADTVQAMAGGVKTQVRTRPTDVPPWALTPMGKVAFRLQSFNYGQTRVLGWAVKEASKGNAVPLFRLLVASALVGEGAADLIDYAKQKVTGKVKPSRLSELKDIDTLGEVGGRILSNILEAGTLGIIGIPIDYAKSPWKKPGPPSLQSVFNVVDSLVYGAKTEGEFLAKLKAAGMNLGNKEVIVWKQYYQYHHGGKTFRQENPLKEEKGHPKRPEHKHPVRTKR